MKRCGFLMIALLLAAPAWAQTADEKKATIAYLKQLQGNDGGFVAALAPGPRGPSSLRATTAALRALRYLGSEIPNVEKCKAYVAGAFDARTGGFRDVQPELRPDVPSTAVGLMALVELKMAEGKFVEPAVKFLTTHARTFEDIRIAAAGLEAVGKRSNASEKWLETVTKSQNATGTYGIDDGAARETGGAVVTVLRLGGKVDSAEAVLKVLNAGQRSDGGFGHAGTRNSDLETTYRVVRCYVLLGKKPDVAKCLGFIARCRNEDGGYASQPGLPSNVGATYFASILQHWLTKR